MIQNVLIVIKILCRMSRRRCCRGIIAIAVFPAVHMKVFP